MVGIYVIINKINNKCYIGKSVNILNRWKTHINKLDTCSHHNVKLQRAWLKYGRNNFEFAVVEQCDKDKMVELENYYIELYGNYNMLATSQEKHILQQIIIQTSVLEWVYNGISLKSLIDEGIIETGIDNEKKEVIINNDVETTSDIETEFYKSFYEVLKQEK